MKFFVDTADIAEIKDLAATGLLDGVTTNPSLVAASGAKNFISLIVKKSIFNRIYPMIYVWWLMNII